MRLVRFRQFRRVAIGAVLDDNRVVDLQAAAVAYLTGKDDPCASQEAELRIPDDICSFLAGGEKSLTLAVEAINFAVKHRYGLYDEPLLLARTGLRLLSPVQPPLLIGQGAHFRPAVSSEDLEKHAELYLRNPYSIAGSEEPIKVPAWLPGPAIASPRLAVVIGSAVSNANLQEAQQAIFGYCAALDIRLQGLNKLSWAGALWHLQYPHARSYDGSLMLGPMIVSKDSISSLNQLKASLAIGAGKTQEFHLPGTANIPAWISHISQAVTLKPGSILVCGSADDAVIVSSTANAATPVTLIPNLDDALQENDVVSISVADLGDWETRVVKVEENEVRA